MTNIIVLGCGRSGTSMIAGAITTAGQRYNIGGVPHRPDQLNEKGYFETYAVNSINDDILKTCEKVETTRGVRQGWLSIVPVDTKIDACSDSVRIRISSVTGNKPYLFKDPRFSYTLPVWLPYLTNCKFICVFRDLSEFLQSVVRTCQTAKYLNGIIVDEEFFRKIWFNTYNYILHHYSHLNIFYVNCSQFVKGFDVNRLSDFVGHEINRNFADKELIHFNPNNLDLCADDKSIELYNKLNDMAKEKNE